MKLLTTLLFVPIALGAPRQQTAEELGVSGSVIAPDKTPVSAGSVMIQSPSGPVTTSIERGGRFHFVPTVPGRHELFVNVPGLAAYRVDVIVPASRTVKLPVIRMVPATFFRVRFIAAAGEPVTSPRLRRQSLDVYGVPLANALSDRSSEETASDGTITIGPLPRGVTLLALDTPTLPQTRLPDLFVNGGDPLLDGGTVIVQPGATLEVELVDAGGVPVPGHDVVLEDALPLPLGPYRPTRTNQQGRATFDRLGAGRYRVSTRTARRCANQLLSIGRVVTVSGAETLRARLVIGGNATFRVTSPLGPLRGILVSASPDLSLSPPPAWLRNRGDSSPFSRAPFTPFTRETVCAGRTDTDGRVTLTNFPPGPARVQIHLLNSTYVRRLGVPEDSREVAIVIPDGYVPLRVTNAITNAPVGVAEVTWTGAGGRVQATTNGNGEALLEGGGTTAGTLAIQAQRYQPAEIKLSEPPGMLQEVPLAPTPSTTVQAQIVSVSGLGLAAVVVELFPEDPFEVPQVAVTDTKGFVSFPNAPPGAFRLTASADGFAPSVLRVAGDKRSGIILTLSPGAPLPARPSAFGCLGQGQAPRRCEHVAQGIALDAR